MQAGVVLIIPYFGNDRAIGGKKKQGGGCHEIWRMLQPKSVVRHSKRRFFFFGNLGNSPAHAV